MLEDTNFQFKKNIFVTGPLSCGKTTMKEAAKLIMKNLTLT